MHVLHDDSCWPQNTLYSMHSLVSESKSQTERGLLSFEALHSRTERIELSFEKMEILFILKTSTPLLWIWITLPWATSLSLSLYVYIRSYINKYQYKCVVVISGVTTWVRFTQVISAWKDMISVRRTPIPWGCQDVWHKSRGALHPSYSKCIFSQYRKKTTVKWNEICDEVFN